MDSLKSNSYRIANKNGIEYLYIPAFEYLGIKHFFTTRKSEGYNSIPFKSIDEFVMVRQVHGDNMLIIDSPVNDISSVVEDSSHCPADGIITNQKNLAIGVVTADCLPVLLYDPVGSVIASVHAGWRGTIKGILSKVVCQMAYVFKCQVEDIMVAIGPTIGSCCYAVGKAVIEPLKRANPEWAKPEWDRYLTHSGDGKARLDLTALNMRQIEDAGILGKNVFKVGLCTSCNQDLFFSYRRDGVGRGRMISGIVT